MEYYDDDDYTHASPGLTPFQPDLGDCSPLPFAPLWLPQDTCEAPLDLIHVERTGNGRETRRKLHKMYRSEAPPTEWEFMDSLLFHQMAPENPQLTLSLGLDGPLPSDSDSDAETLSDDAAWRLTSDSLPDYSIVPKRARKPRKARLSLPITIHKQGILATVLACADTGSDVNIISHEVAKTLGYSEYEALPEKKQFSLANGKLIEAIGRIESPCSFGVETSSLVTMTCAFYVLLKSATPIIMGQSFLEETKTMTEYRERLVRVPTPAFQALSVYSVGRPRRLLKCEVDRRETLATPDSGSEIDLISPSFVAERGLTVYPGEEAIQLADGSIATTSGYVHVDIAVTSINSWRPLNHPKRNVTVDLFLLDSLNHDLIVSEDSLEELKVFTHHQSALILAPHDSGPLGINRIRHLGAIDRIISWIKKKIKSSGSENDTNMDISSDLQAVDQRENDRREREAARIAILPNDEQQAAIEAEVVRQEAYKSRLRLPNFPLNGAIDPGTPLPPPNSSLQSTPNITGMFRCHHPDCTAAPFQTQYLLKYIRPSISMILTNESSSHNNVHASNRLHFCPVAGCPRGEGGKGFKRKNEMIRHGLLHQSPGYVCPFCPDSERKYPRPDNLERYVKIKTYPATSEAFY
ncbi:hypothetical protein AA0111_g12094 [Alternaria arborescens]|uniref:hypothetical protein n=1 Tax=Alternaria arborescens TaxID=156630 RepID=UPI001074D702|nr:hypothetical protein AA0111_g12094 [Alternaria arborescens]RYO14027.1 hypothetical protein AA0111_g12094 [Alternaria arborescens]